MKIQLKSLELAGIFSYISTFIDFTSAYQGPTLILGSRNGNYDLSNGAGKSAIFNAILWAIYGKCYFGKVTDSILTDSIEGYASVTFCIDNIDELTIKRSCSKTSSSTLQVFLNKKDISGETLNETQKIINSYILVNFEIFRNCIYFGQEDFEHFCAQKGSSIKQNFFLSLLQLDSFNHILSELSERRAVVLKNLQTAIAQKDALNELNIDISLISSQINELDFQIAELENLISNLSNKTVLLDNDLRKLYDIKLDIIKRTNLLKRRDFLIAEVIKKRNNFETTQNKLITENSLFLADIANIDIELQHYDEEIIKAQLVELSNNLDNAKKNLLILERDKLYIEQSLEQLRKTLIATEEFFNVNQNLRCPTCFVILSYENADIAKSYLKSEIIAKTKLLEDLDMREANASTTCKELQATLFTFESMNFLLQKKNDLLKKVSANNFQLIELNLLLTEIKNLENEVEKINEELLQFSDNLQFEEIERTCELIETEKKHFLDMMSNANTNLISKSANKQALLADLKKQEQLSQKCQDLVSEIAKYESILILFDVLLTAFGRSGIQLEIIEESLAQLEERANYYLENFLSDTPTFISFSTQRSKKSDPTEFFDKFEIFVTTNDMQRSYFQYSPGERRRIDFSIRLALRELGFIRLSVNLDFIFLDEIMDSLDVFGRNKFLDLLTFLKKDISFVGLISHDSTLQSSFDTVLLVEKINELATATFN